VNVKDRRGAKKGWLYIVRHLRLSQARNEVGMFLNYMFGSSQDRLLGSVLYLNRLFDPEFARLIPFHVFHPVDAYAAENDADFPLLQWKVISSSSSYLNSWHHDDELQ